MLTEACFLENLARSGGRVICRSGVFHTAGSRMSEQHSTGVGRGCRNGSGRFLSDVACGKASTTRRAGQRVRHIRNAPFDDTLESAVRQITHWLARPNGCASIAAEYEIHFGRLLILFSRSRCFLSDCSTCEFDVARRFNDLRRAAFFFAMPVPLWLVSSHSCTVFRMME